MANLFQQIDTSGSGSISKAQFEQAFQTLNPPPVFKAMGADALFSKLDPNGAGSISKQDFINGMKPMVAHAHHHHEAARNDQAQATTQTLANSTNTLNALGNPPPAPIPSGVVGNNINTTA